MLAVTPALPLHTAGKYVAGAYIVFVLMLLVYLGIMSLRTSRTNRQLGELRAELARRDGQEPEAQQGGDLAASMASGNPAVPEREPAL